MDLLHFKGHHWEVSFTVRGLGSVLPDFDDIPSYAESTHIDLDLVSIIITITREVSPVVRDPGSVPTLREFEYRDFTTTWRCHPQFLVQALCHPLPSSESLTF